MAVTCIRGRSKKAQKNLVISHVGEIKIARKSFLERYTLTAGPAFHETLHTSLHHFLVTLDKPTTRRENQQEAHPYEES